MLETILICAGVAVTTSLVVTEIVLIVTMRAAVNELRVIRAEIPKLVGLAVGVNLLLAAAQFAQSRQGGSGQGG